MNDRLNSRSVHASAIPRRGFSSRRFVGVDHSKLALASHPCCDRVFLPGSVSSLKRNRRICNTLFESAKRRSTVRRRNSKRSARHGRKKTIHAERDRKKHR